MTYAFALMNKNGVVLAADHAKKNDFGVQTARIKKLFELSPHHPISILVYNNYHYYNIPIESIIDLYRRELQNGYYDHAQFYFDDFLDFLENRLHKTCDLQAYEEKSISNFISTKVQQLYGETLGMQQHVMNEQPNITEDELEQLFFTHGDHRINYELKQLEKETLLERFSKDDEIALFEKYERDIVHTVTQTYHEYKDDWPYKITSIVIQHLLKSLTDNTIGIVVAGYGAKETLPSLYRIEIDGKVNGKLRCKHRTIAQPTLEEDMLYFGFNPMNKMAETMNGTSEPIKEALNDTFKMQTEKVVKELLQELFTKGIDQDTVLPIVNNELRGFMYDVQNELLNIQSEQFERPSIQLLNDRSIDDLLEIAYTLLHAELFGNQLTAEITDQDILYNIASITKTSNVVFQRQES